MDDNFHTLPDTQTQSQREDDYDEVTSSQESQEFNRPWGRLSSCSPNLSSIDLFAPTYTCGRAPYCSIVIGNNVPQFNTDNISKTHFEVTKEDDIVYLRDHSKNGTFVNGRKVGKNNRFILNNNDVIALGLKNRRAFIFNSSHNDDSFLPTSMQKKYYVSKILGKGAVGEVRYALDKQSTKEYAIKRIIKGATSKTGQLNHPLKIQTEIQILKSLSHPFIIEMKEVHETDQEVHLVLEFMQGGDLGGRILSTVPFVEGEAKYVFYQMLLAVQYLHQHGVTHRDLKPENVLLTTGGCYPHIKISDFGLSKIMDERSMMETICGTVNYAAPEILNRREKTYTKKIDVWSLGVILFYMLSKRLPFFGENTVTNILNGRYDVRFLRDNSDISKDLIRKMLTKDPALRISVDEIFEHQWIEQDTPMQDRVEKLMSDYNGSDDSDLFDQITPPVKRGRYTV